jgi:hypothetical protein
MYAHMHKIVLFLYFRLRHKDVFQLIHKHNLFGAIYDMIEDLMDLDVDQAISMFLEKERIPSEVVVTRLQNNQHYLYLVS